MTDLAPLRRIRLEITGQVQGVGFRPTVYRLARRLHLAGWIVNDTRGVRIELQGPGEALEAFVDSLGADGPPLAEITDVRRRDVPVAGDERTFRILPSDSAGLVDAQVTVDTATCEDCLAELRDPADPRHAYPFINCTNCGPRYTIIHRVPYDRPNTTMAEFDMCPLCGGQYTDPLDRRFHAQPIACPACGPRVWLVDSRGQKISCDDAIAESARLLRDGKIVALKGLGGFHLACRADDVHAVGRLRERKHRDAKPFALMVADLDRAEALCEISPPARGLLAGPIRPIVLLPRRPGANVAAGVADGLDTLGVMLPYTPLHHLLLGQPELADLPLVMTSGNLASEPLVTDNADAVAHLGHLADAILLHDRGIERRIDDSIAQVSSAGRLSLVRRARGFAPQPIPLSVLPKNSPKVLAVGAELKNAVCLLTAGRAVLSEHIGDLKDPRTCRHFIDVIGHIEKLYGFRPDAIAADLHPQYVSSEYASRRHRRDSLPVVAVQHHHAHVAACLAEHGLPGPAIGLACDGVGYGEDGAVWGCEVLRFDLREFQRLGHLRYQLLWGGDAAAVQTYRPALAALYDTFGEAAMDLAVTRRLVPDAAEREAAAAILRSGAGCTPSSSLGRWFDAVAALAGLAQVNRYEAQAPMQLEAAIERGVDESYPFAIDDSEPFQIDLRPMVERIVADGCRPAVVAAKFHNTVAAFLLAAADRAGRRTGLDTIALSGGCFANRYLTERLTRGLVEAGFTVLRHHRIPTNDGGVCLGQAVVAAMRLCESVEM